MLFICPGNGAGSPGLTVRHPALPSVRVPSAAPLALCQPDRSRYGLPGDEEVHPQRPGRQERPASIQRDGEDRGFRPDEGPEPRCRSLRHGGA